MRQLHRPLIGAPLVVALVRLPGGGDFDIGRAAQNMMEAAAALGIGSCPVTLHRETCARERLNVPDDHGCRFVLAFGYPDTEGERSSARASGRPSPGDANLWPIWFFTGRWGAKE